MPTLDWIGKDITANRHMYIPFRALERKYSFNENTQLLEYSGSKNMIVHGDNLDVLKALLPEYKREIKCIYIDSPHKIGKENWINNDNVNDPSRCVKGMYILDPLLYIISVCAKSVDIIKGVAKN